MDTPQRKRTNKKKGKKKTFDSRRPSSVSIPSTKTEKAAAAPSEREQRKAAHAERKAHEAREAQRAAEAEKFQRDKKANLQKNDKLVDWFNEHHPMLNEDELYWLTSALGELWYEPGYIIYLLDDGETMAYRASYEQGIHIGSLCFWKGECRSTHKQVKIPETVRDFINRHTISESPDESEYPLLQHGQRVQSHMDECEEFLRKWLQDRLPE